jgi:hypothetical protein
MLRLWFQKNSQGFDALSVSGITSVCYQRFNKFKLCCVAYHVWLCISHTVNNFPQVNCFPLKLIYKIWSSEWYSFLRESGNRCDWIGGKFSNCTITNSATTKSASANARFAMKMKADLWELNKWKSFFTFY